MSDRTKVTDPAVADASAPAETGQPGDRSRPEPAGPTRADRVMGRARDGARGRGPGGSRPSGQPAGAGPDGSATGSNGSAPGPQAQGDAPAQPSQRPTAVPGTARTGAGPARPSDGWGRGATSRPAPSPVDDDVPTRVNPAVSPSAAAPAARGEDATSGHGPAGATAPAGTTTEAEDETTRTLAGTGALGTVSRSMEEPTQPLPSGGAVTAGKETTTTRTAAAKASGRKARRARLRLSRIDPWSVMKTSFLFSIALGIAGWVLVAFVWWVIQQSGLFGAVNTIVADMFSAPGDADPFRLEAYVNGSRVLGLAALLAVVDVLLITAMATVASFLYNLSATMLGGLQVTLAETDD